MYGPKLYYDNFYTGNKENKIIVFMPNIEKCNYRFNEVIKPALEIIKLDYPNEYGDYKIERIEEERSGREIPDKIYEAIENSKLLIFDISSDERCGNEENPNVVNPNVIYELGMARSIRYDKDILLITDIQKIETEVPFDIRIMNINKKLEEISGGEQFSILLKSILERQKYYEDKRVAKIAHSLDWICLDFIIRFGTRGLNFFSNDIRNPVEQNAIFRLLDFGIIKTEAEYNEGRNVREMSYHWTDFGKAVSSYFKSRLNL